MKTAYFGAMLAASTLMGCEGENREIPSIESSLASLDKIEERSIEELSAGMADGKYSSEAITSAYIERIKNIDENGPELRSIIALMPDAIEQARLRDQQRADGKVFGPLHGIPILLKDNIEALGPVPTTAGSTALKDNITNRDAPLVAKLRAAGAIILGKTNLSQWANMRSFKSTSGWSSIGGLVKNPHSLAHNSCGSSSGSGAAVTASLAGGAIGTETDGSVVCPASLNGVVGLKPTVGLVSRTHIVPISHSQDTAGPMSRTVRGTAYILSAMSGTDSADTATAEADTRRMNYAEGLSKDALKNMRIGILRDQVGDQPQTTKLFNKAVATLSAQGAIVVEIDDSAIDSDAMGEAEFKVLLTEFKAGMKAYLGSLPDSIKSRTLADLIAFNQGNSDVELAYFDQNIFELAQKEKGLDDPEYQKALETSQLMAGRDGIDRLLREHDVQLLVAPTTGPAWLSTLGKGDAFSGPSASQWPAVSGYPHLTVPMGVINALPVGISFMGPKWSEHLLLKAGYAYEQASKARPIPKYLKAK